VLVSHAAEELAEHADRIALLSRGELRALGTPHEVYSQVELLSRNDVRPPQVVTTFHLLRERGVMLDSPSLPITLEAGRAALAQLVAQRPNLAIAEPAAPTATPESAPPLIEADDLKYHYPDGTAALRGVSLRIRRGEYVALIGQNGAGKSTLLKHFLKLLRPHGGTLRIAGTDAEKLDASELSRHIGYVAQNPDLQIFNATVEDEVAFALRHLGHSNAEVEARVVKSLESMGLLHTRKAHPLSLPRGHRARVIIAAVLAMHPDTIIFDEPTIGQDDAGARRILDMTRLLHEQGKTILVVTHHLHLMPPYARRVVVMGEGSVLLDAPLRTAYHDVETLSRTHLAPPQAVLLAKELERLTGRRAPLLTPEELAACLTMEKAA
jgi:energy-coupling factor transport system ATP-binding protein